MERKSTKLSKVSSVKKKTELQQKETEFPHLVVLGAFRYALGRETNIVPFIADWICENWDNFADGTKNIILGEISDAINLGFAGSEIDENCWRKVLNLGNKNCPFRRQE